MSNKTSAALVTRPVSLRARQPQQFIQEGDEPVQPNRRLLREATGAAAADLLGQGVEIEEFGQLGEQELDPRPRDVSLGLFEGGGDPGVGEDTVPVVTADEGRVVKDADPTNEETRQAATS
jgi:hypothetical protein